MIKKITQFSKKFVFFSGFSLDEGFVEKLAGSNMATGYLPATAQVKAKLNESLDQLWRNCYDR